MHIPVVWIVLFALANHPAVPWAAVHQAQNADTEGALLLRRCWPYRRRRFMGAQHRRDPAFRSGRDRTHRPTRRLARFADRLDERLAAETGKVLTVGAAIHQNALAISRSVNAPPQKGGDN